MARNVFTVTVAGELLGTFNENELTLDDEFVLENTTDLTFSEMLVEAVKGKARGLRALVWFMHYKRGTAPPSINDIKFKLVDLVTEAVPDPTPGEEDAGSSDATTSGTSPKSAT